MDCGSFGRHCSGAGTGSILVANSEVTLAGKGGPGGGDPGIG